MATPLDRVTLARISTASLAALAGLRCVRGVAVLPGPEWSWVWWEPGEARVLRAVLPTPGVALFEDRGGAWYRPGAHLPSFEVPPGDGRVGLDRVILPEPFAAVPGPDPATIEPAPLRLARDDRPRPTTAALCPLGELARWADSATSAEIGAIRGAISGDSALLMGDSLPAWPGSERFWGRSVLIPLGFEARPDLPEPTLRGALGAVDDAILLLIRAGDDRVEVESIPPGAFAALTRAGVRLAAGGWPE